MMKINNKMIDLYNICINLTIGKEKRKITKCKSINNGYLDLDSNPRLIGIKYQNKTMLCTINNIEFTYNLYGESDITLNLTSNTLKNKFTYISSNDLTYIPSKDYELKIMGRGDDIYGSK